VGIGEEGRGEETGRLGWMGERSSKQRSFIGVRAGKEGESRKGRTKPRYFLAKKASIGAWK